jgi:flavin reductase (DIM6/NTAB) family NADH-FMN oxidoreductase RutF
VTGAPLAAAGTGARTFDSRTFRGVLGKFGTGVTVVTTATESGIHGMTANSFVSVSLEPPLVLVAMGNGTQMHERLAESGRYAVSVLSESDEWISQHFAGRPSEGRTPRFEIVNNVPVIPGAIGTLVCRVVDAHPAGDHTLYIGEVEACKARWGSPLLFFGGRYARLGAFGGEADLWSEYEHYGRGGMGA